jgi:hypothetical protein
MAQIARVEGLLFMSNLPSARRAFILTSHIRHYKVSWLQSKAKTAGNGIDFFGAMAEKAFLLAQGAEI